MMRQRSEAGGNEPSSAPERPWEDMTRLDALEDLLNLRSVTPLGVMIVTVLVGCSSFGGASGEPPTSDAGSDGAQIQDGSPVTGLGVPGAPVAVTPVAIPVVATVTTLAGSGAVGAADGTGAAASFNAPYAAAVDASGNLYVSDVGNALVRKVTPTGVVSTVAGSGAAGFAEGIGAAASFNFNLGVTVDASGTVYVGDTGNRRIRKVTPGGVVTTLAGSGATAYADGTGAAASFGAPYGVAADATGSVYVADYLNRRIRKVTSSGVVTTVAGSGTQDVVDGTGAAASFYLPFAVAVDSRGDLYVADFNCIRKVTESGVVTTIAGSRAAGFAEGTGTAASFNQVYGVAVDGAGNVFVSDSGNNRIRRVTTAGVVTTLAGSGSQGFADGEGTMASFGSLGNLGSDAAGVVYVPDQNGSRIRKLTSVGIGQLAVSWSAPEGAGNSDIDSYTAKASTAGQSDKTCTSTGTTHHCTIGGLLSGVSYSVSVTARNGAGTSPPSLAGSAIPN